MTDSSQTPALVRSPLVPLALFVMSSGFAIWSNQLPEIPRMMPFLVAMITAVLCVLDFLARGKSEFAQKIGHWLGADFSNREMKHNPAISAEAVMILWMLLCVSLMMFIGILPSIFIFVLVYMRYQGKQSWRNSILASIGNLLFVVAVFEVLLQYNLYRGALFDSRGFDAW
ncbi:MAG: tripartite tricarboxylate transporter TctB family protein [Alphaproteobacteria bacterium]|jgi:hypothetical protein|nr:tripartite tricarboxylate transporter TctB family protein [Alphaproteobacteria bacterium]MDP4925058.1 tripartite tricarboxylate transporter TctB family protein [Alphaproteobacteria bacterium]